MNRVAKQLTQRAVTDEMNFVDGEQGCTVVVLLTVMAMNTFIMSSSMQMVMVKIYRAITSLSKLMVVTVLYVTIMENM